MNLTKDLKAVFDEILRLKQSARVASTITTYDYYQTMVLPAKGDHSVYPIRLKVTYKESNQPHFSVIGVFWMASPNVGEDAMRSPVVNNSQYLWLQTYTGTEAREKTLHIISTAEVESVELAPE